MRVPDSQLNGPVPVDYLAGSQFHRCEALRALGPYREELFFGFEEAEYGLRARRAGWALFADGEMWFEDRVKAGRLNLKKGSSIPNTAAWRRFYSARNITALAREYGSRPTAALRVAVRTAVSGAIALLRTGRPMRDVMAPLRGSLDGYRGKLGRTINPAKANKVN